MINLDVLRSDTEEMRKVDVVMDALFSVSCALFACTLPFQRHINPFMCQWLVVVGLYRLYLFLRGREAGFSIHKLGSVAVVSLLLFSLLCIASQLWTYDEEATRGALRPATSVLYVCLIYFLQPKRIPKDLMLRFFTYGVTALLAWCLLDISGAAMAGRLEIYTDPQRFVFDYFDVNLQHHIYMATYIGLSLFYIADRLFGGESGVMEKCYFLVHTVLCVAVIIVDNSRVLMVALFLTTVVSLGYVALRARKALLKSLLVIIPLGACLYLIPNRTSKTIDSALEKREVSDPRLKIWEALLKGVDDVPFLGYGYEGMFDKYHELFNKNGAGFAAYLQYRSHNQLIESYFTLGVPGVLLIVMLIAGFLIHAVLARSVLSVGCLILMLSQMMFDVPFFYNYATPMVYAMMALIHSGKEDMDMSKRKWRNGLCGVLFAVFAVVSVVLAYRAVAIKDRYSKHGEIELEGLKSVKKLKKAMKRWNLKAEDGIEIVLGGDRDEMMYICSSFCTDSRNIALIESKDTVCVSAECYVSEDFDGDKVYLAVNHYGSKQARWPYCEADTSKRGEWQKVGLEVPSVYNVEYTDPETGARINKFNARERNLVYAGARNEGAYGYSCMKGYVAFRNIKIERKGK